MFFELPLRSAAEEVVRVYPKISADLERIFGWGLGLQPSVLLIRNREDFQSMTESASIVAFAVPSRKLIVIDYSRMNIPPFTIENILKHELCHLLLHHHIRGTILPRWLDEGVCQWASDGIGEIIMDQKHSVLNKAALRGTFIPLDLLNRGFPRDKDSMILAYEESKSFITHIISKFGKEGILEVLENMKTGKEVDVAFSMALSMPLGRLEEEWHHALRQRTTWFIYLSYHLYEVLFALLALITIYAFIRTIIKKRNYGTEEGEDVGV
ncbi:MAG: peptidase MA family metallohydrolase [Thermodesulfobacteriota bacterium]|nr:peptidase MA family metallohydrolase [Thermodesulfobacteriota bacterium]